MVDAHADAEGAERTDWSDAPRTVAASCCGSRLCLLLVASSRASRASRVSSSP